MENIMKKYLALAALFLAGSVYAAEETTVEASVNPEEVVVTEKDVKDAVEAVQTVFQALAEEIKAEEAAEEVAK